MKSVYSHPQALAQCRTYLQKRKLEPIPTYDTAGAVKIIKERKLMDYAPIAEVSSKIFEMDILDEGIEDKRNNFTRFLVLSKFDTQPTNNDKTSIIFSVKHVPESII